MLCQAKKLRHDLMPSHNKYAAKLSTLTPNSNYVVLQKRQGLHEAFFHASGSILATSRLSRFNGLILALVTAAARPLWALPSRAEGVEFPVAV